MIRRRLTFANVVSCIALFVALGGVGYAATQLPKDSVGTRQLQKDAVTSAKVRNDSLQLADLSPQVSQVVTRPGRVVTVNQGTDGISYAGCEAGEVATGGGYAFGVDNGLPPEEKFRLISMRPSLKIEKDGEPPFYGAPGNGQAAEGWVVEIENRGSPSFEFRAYTLCAKTG